MTKSDGQSLNRLSWLEPAIEETRAFCDAVEKDAELERGMAAFGSLDYDWEIDLNHQAVMARKTLALMEEERASILARARMRKERERREHEEWESWHRERGLEPPDPSQF